MIVQLLVSLALIIDKKEEATGSKAKVREKLIKSPAVWISKSVYTVYTVSVHTL